MPVKTAFALRAEHQDVDGSGTLPDGTHYDVGQALRRGKGVIRPQTDDHAQILRTNFAGVLREIPVEEAEGLRHREPEGSPSEPTKEA